MKERIKAIRKHAGLTQAEFGIALGLGPTSAAAWEKKEAQIPTESMQLLICKTFGIDKQWLETGEGDMHAARSSDPLDDLCDKYHLTAMDRGIVRGFVELDADQRAAFLQIARRILDLGASEAFFEIGRSIQTHVPEPESDSIPKDRSS